MEKKVVLEVVVNHENEMNELIQDPKVFGESLHFLINTLKNSPYRDTENFVWEGEDFDVVFML